MCSSVYKMMYFFFLNLDVSKDIAFFFCFRAHMCSFCGPFMWPRGMCHCNFLIGEVRQGRAIPKRFDGVPMVQMSMMHPPPADMLDQSDPDDDAIPPPCALVPSCRVGSSSHAPTCCVAATTLSGGGP
jgi:hypothetical protein